MSRLLLHKASFLQESSRIQDVLCKADGHEELCIDSLYAWTIIVPVNL